MSGFNSPLFILGLASVSLGAQTYIVGGKIYEATADQASIVNGVIVEETLGAQSYIDSNTAYLASGSFALSGNECAIAVSSTPSPERIYLDGGYNFYVGGNDLEISGGSLTMQLAAAAFAITGKGFGHPSLLTYSFNSDTGTLAVCSDVRFNGTLVSGGWTTVASNNKLWPMREGTGSTLNEIYTGDDSFDATIQNHTEESWG